MWMTTLGRWSDPRRSWRPSEPSCSAARTACGGAGGRGRTLPCAKQPCRFHAAHIRHRTLLRGAALSGAVPASRLLAAAAGQPRAPPGRRVAGPAGLNAAGAILFSHQFIACIDASCCSDELAGARSDHQRVREELLSQQSSVEKRAAIGAAPAWLLCMLSRGLRPVCSCPASGPPAQRSRLCHACTAQCPAGTLAPPTPHPHPHPTSTPLQRHS